MKYFKIKGINRILSISLLFLVNLGCSDFLDEENQSSLNPDSFYKSNVHAESALNGVYASTRFIGGYAGGNSSN